MILTIVLFVSAYLMGSIPTAVWYAGYFHNIDIRQHGSKNAGATNSLRVLGKKAGIIVLIVDALKGLIPVLVAKYFGLPDTTSFLIGLIAIIGHLLPIFSGFKGGKGVATSLGVIIAVSPLGALISLAAFILVVIISGYVSLGSLLAAMVFVIYFLLGSPDFYMSAIAFGVLVLLVFTHRANIKRLMEGSENKFSRKKSN
ncbi:MAG: glycerol-3-phosphate 1-O-acyltransferase PlsY [Spirosomataceae bacterium]|jgi:glycerol-3-phosphate acyltransferase PlsY